MKNKDVNFLYNKIVNLEVILESIVELMIENELTTEEEFHERVTVNIQNLQKEMNKVMETMNNNRESEGEESPKDEGKSPLFWGKRGEA